MGDLNTPLLRLDFGGTYMNCATGFLTSNRVYRSPRFLWLDEVREVWREEEDNPLLEDFVKGKEGELRIGLSPGRYRLRFRFHDSEETHGPFDVSFASMPTRSAPRAGSFQPLLSDITVTPGQVADPETLLRHEGGALSLLFKGRQDSSFLVNALEVWGDGSASLEKLFPEAPDDEIPDSEDGSEGPASDPREVLRKACEWLLDQRDEYGFLGDDDARLKLWYTASYPLRTLLAGYDLFGGRACLDAVTELLDRLVSEQMPYGAFCQSFRNRPTRDSSPQELVKIKHSGWQNLADVGSIVIVLLMALPYVDVERRKKYLEAARRYVDSWVIQFQRPDGGFSNGWIGRKYAEWSYGVSTANTAAVLALLSAVTGNKEYMERAQWAIDFLITDWHEDGRPFIWPHDGYFPRRPYHRSVLEFGDLAYVHEGILITARNSRDADFRRRVWRASRKHLLGSAGLLSCMAEKLWWPLNCAWNNSKSALMPVVLSSYLELADAFEAPGDDIEWVREAYRRCRQFLCTPEYVRRIGVMESPAQLPWGNTQTWSGCAVAATGFAGLALAEMIEPGLPFKKKDTV